MQVYNVIKKLVSNKKREDKSLPVWKLLAIIDGLERIFATYEEVENSLRILVKEGLLSKKENGYYINNFINPFIVFDLNSYEKGCEAYRQKFDEFMNDNNECN